MAGFATPILPPTDKTSKWSPKVGKRSRALMESLPASEFNSDAKKILINETYRILSSCHNPSDMESESTTGLIVGNVQSGKTTSFKALSMMAMDNGFNLFILFAGRTHNLINQNKDAFNELNESIVHKFAVGSVSKPKEWRELIQGHVRKIHGFGSSPNIPLILITNKHAGHINKLAKELNNIRNDVGKLNVMIIDDEADNASLNTAKDKDNEFSATAIYKSIKVLRSSVGCNTVAQYTATPQALLLISKKDHYSPEWARVISPGKNYIGSQDLFFNNSPFYRVVPADEISTSRNIQQLSLPSSFKSAFRSYLLASAQRLAAPKKFHDKNSTFMVHPDVYNITHRHWREIISEEVNLWRQEIDDNIEKFYKNNFNAFDKEYKSLAKACNASNTEISSFETLFKNYVPQVIKEVQITQVNGESNNINWKLPHNILIGGYMLDRGYVVKGLVTTYMPRGKGGGMVDSLQQRGRFYGYKRTYLGFIKTWMSKPTIDAYKSYAKHEEHLYGTLQKLSKEGSNLREWERVLLLDKGLIPCRKNVMGIGLKNDYTHGGGWYYPTYPISGSKENKVLFEGLINHYQGKFKPFEVQNGDATQWTDARSALQVKNQNLSTLLEAIRKYDPGEYDEGKFATSKMILGLLADRKFTASIVLTGTRFSDINKYHKRSRPTMVRPMTSATYFQGTEKNGSYPGERALIDEGQHSITVHLTKLYLGTDRLPSYILAIKFPDENYLVETEIL